MLLLLGCITHSSYSMNIGGPGAFRSEKEKELVLASEKLDWRKVQMLLAEQVDPNARPNYGRTALMIACSFAPPDAKEDNIRTVQSLLVAGADPNFACESFETALLLAAGCHNIEVIPLLLKAGARVTKAGPHGFSPLEKAYRYGYIDYRRGADLKRLHTTIKLLKEAGAVWDGAIEYGFLEEEPKHKPVDILMACL